MKIEVVYKIGRIKSKYIILEVLAYASYGSQIFWFLFGASRCLRKLLVVNRLLASAMTCSDVMEVGSVLRFLERRVLEHGVYRLTQPVNHADIADMVDIKHARRGRLFLIDEATICTTSAHFRLKEQVEEAFKLLGKHFSPTKLNIEIGQYDFRFELIPQTALERVKVTLGEFTQILYSDLNPVIPIKVRRLELMIAEGKDTLLETMFKRIAPSHTLVLEWPNPDMVVLADIVRHSGLRLIRLEMQCDQMSKEDYKRFKLLTECKQR